MTDPTPAAASCPKCGYTQADVDFHGDHRLCDGPGPTPAAATPEPRRRPGHLYVLLALREDILNGPSPEHVEQFIEVEDHEGRGSGAPRSFEEGDYRLLEFAASPSGALAAARASLAECVVEGYGDMPDEKVEAIAERGKGWDKPSARRELRRRAALSLLGEGVKP